MAELGLEPSSLTALLPCHPLTLNEKSDGEPDNSPGRRRKPRAEASGSGSDRPSLVVLCLPQILQEMLHSMDDDKDGFVSLQEWVNAGMTTIPLLVLLGMDDSVSQERAFSGSGFHLVASGCLPRSHFSILSLCVLKIHAFP